MEDGRQRQGHALGHPIEGLGQLLAPLHVELVHVHRRGLVHAAHAAAHAQRREAPEQPTAGLFLVSPFDASGGSVFAAFGGELGVDGVDLREDAFLLLDRVDDVAVPCGFEFQQLPITGGWMVER